MKRILPFALILFFLTACNSNPSNANSSEDLNESQLLAYQQVDEANPLKGFAPFMGTNNAIPTSLEFFYIPMNQIEAQKGIYDFSPIEENLEEIKTRGHQTVFRIYLDYPDLESGVPDFFWDDGIEKIYYLNPSTNEEQYFPDYTNQTCIDYICDFIKELGEKYDGDERIAFIFCGFIGHWGEWHNYYYTQTQGHEGDKMPDQSQQEALYKCFSSSFNKTFTMTRYPSSSILSSLENIGYHDDSFTEDTIDDSKSWFFMTQLKNTNQTVKWKTAVIGGEFRPENQVPFLRGEKYADYYQDFDECLQATHCSWLIYDAAFYGNRSQKERKVGWEASKKLGYDLYCSNAEVDSTEEGLEVKITISNKGYAPFYYNWQARLLLVKEGEIIAQWDNPFSDWELPKLLPDESTDYTASLNLPSNASSQEALSGSKLLLTIPNPMEGGIPLKFSNASLNRDMEGYITLKNFN
ncbi:MAG: DUF4832 domain-containing protein [Treponema sp.]|nr:DUF4832 domain-containing protein [Treponema sp.]